MVTWQRCTAREVWNTVGVQQIKKIIINLRILVNYELLSIKNKCLRNRKWLLAWITNNYNTNIINKYKQRCQAWEKTQWVYFYTSAHMKNGETVHWMSTTSYCSYGTLDKGKVSEGWAQLLAGNVLKVFPSFTYLPLLRPEKLEVNFWAKTTKISLLSRYLSVGIDVTENH